MRHLDLFSGIGGFALAASWVWGEEHEIVSFCEIEDYPQRVLKKHWPDVPCHDDIKTLKGDSFGTVDLITGGFPCQPFSVAGKQGGSSDDRHLWPEMFRVIQEAKPAWIIGENVAGLINMVEFEQCFLDLESEGYETQAFIIPACAKDAKHRRDRVWIVAHNELTISGGGGFFKQPCQQRRGISEEKSKGIQPKDRESLSDNIKQSSEDVADTKHYGSHNKKGDEAKQGGNREKDRLFERGSSLEPEPPVGRTLDGLSRFLDRNIGLTFKSHECIMAYVIQKGDIQNATEAINRAEEELHSLWCEVDSEEIREEIGGLGGIQKEEVLLSYLCELQNSFDETWVQLEGEKTLEGLLRGLRNKDKPSRPPYRPEYKKQRSWEYPDSLCELSRVLAQHSQEAWVEYCGPNASPWAGDWEKGVPRVASKIPSRVDRLKGLGNAIVPQVVVPIMQAIKEINQ